MKVIKEEFVLFGAGGEGKWMAEYICSEKSKIAFFVDNDEKKRGLELCGVPIYFFEEKKSELKDYCVVISVSEKYMDEIKKQLLETGISDYMTVSELREELVRRKIEATKRKILSRMDMIGIYNKAIEWVKKNSIASAGIISNTASEKPYPEVTGYYIPTLIRWGYRDLAVQYAKWLCKIQKEDGSWYEINDVAPYVFDTAQILKGLLAIREIYPYVDDNIKKGCEWVLSNMEESGRLTTPDVSAWGDEGMCSELIHLYCLSPLIKAGKVFENADYVDAAKKILAYYKNNYYDEIMNFGLLSHFYAYVMEALVDMGEMDMAKEAMEKVAELQGENGAVPAYNNVHWVCSVGLFQFAIVWYRLGELERGNKAFYYACKLQNESGGWYGSYMVEGSEMETNSYFSSEEISWAAKFFLDAFFYKNKAEFNARVETFLEKIEKDDGRYRCIRKSVGGGSSRQKVLDVGCGKGRYLKNLIEEEPENMYFAVDISEKVMSKIDYAIKTTGTLTNIPYSDNTFDVTYTCEALEHAVDIRSAVREMARVTKNGGKIIVIDKNNERLGEMEIEEWEQWFGIKELKNVMSEFCNEVNTYENLCYENGKQDKLFCAWVGIVK